MIKNITRNDISDFINEEFGLPKNDCNEIVNLILDEITLGLIKNDIVKIHNFGTFKLRHKAQRIGRNPKTKEEVMIPPRNVISFIPSKKILKILNTENNESKEI